VPLLLPADWNTPRGWKKLSETAPLEIQRKAPPWQGGVSLDQWLWWDQYRPTTKELRLWIEKQQQPVKRRR